MASRLFNWTSFLLLTLLLACNEESDQLDVLIRGGMLLDGVGERAQTLDVGIRADTIAFIGTAATAGVTAKKTVEAEGYYVTPGFIDPHTHALKDLSDSLKNRNLNYLLQGVTTVVTGSDGNSDNYIEKRLALWDSQGIGTNAAIMVGHRNIRRLIMGMEERAPSEEELTNMKTMVKRGMDAGALGFSSGLYYAPASFATTEEVIELATVSASYGGLYDVHIRDESTYNIGLLAAVEETIEIAGKAKIRANISHIKCLGVDVWGQSQIIIDTIVAARNRGLQITADQYPYRASGTHLSAALLPKWVFANIDDYSLRFDDPDLRPTIKAGIAENIRRRGGAASLLIILADLPDLDGKNLEEIASEWEMPVVETAIEIMRKGDAAIASFNMDETDLQLFMQQDWVMTGSDGTSAHPRKYATFSTKITEFVLTKKVLNLAQMIRKSSSLVAEMFGISKRGSIQVGNYADILVFKPEEIRANATYADPAVLSSGMHYIFLNGEVVVQEGTPNNQLMGRVVRREK